MSIFNKLTKKLKKSPAETKKEKKIKKSSLKGDQPSAVGLGAASENNDWFKPEGELAVDVFQNKNYFFIEAPVAGVETKDLDIVIDQDTIKIKGKREKPQKISDDKYLIKECYWGRFTREVILPQKVDGPKTKAEIKDGILIIKTPKIEEESEKKIKIKEK